MIPIDNYRFMVAKGKEIVDAMDPSSVHHSAELTPVEIQKYQSAHMTSGAITGRCGRS